MVKVLVVGSGGVGAICAFALHHNKKCEVTLVVRSDYDLIMNQGFSINSQTYGEHKNFKPHNIAKSVQHASDEFGPFDYILLTTKNIPDGPITCEEIIKPAIKSGSETIILMQNGVHIEDAMLEAYPNNLILSGVTLTGSTYQNGVVNHVGKDIVFIGSFKQNETSPKLQEFINIYQDDVNEVSIDSNVQKTRWEKLIYNSSFNPLSALVDLDVTRLQINNLNEEIIKTTMRECFEIAKSDGVLCDESKLDLYLHYSDGRFYPPSMLIDMRKGQLMELEIILGNPIRVAKKNNVSAPTLSILYSLLKCVQFRLKEQRGMFKIDEDDFNKISSDDCPKVFKEKYIDKNK